MTRFASIVIIAGLAIWPTLADQPVGRKAGAAKEVKDPIDPVSGRKVDPKIAVKAVHEGKTYYFSSKENKETFEREPGKYVKTRKSPRK
jgi:YHS domain-containing protein